MDKFRHTHLKYLINYKPKTYEKKTCYHFDADDRVGNGGCRAGVHYPCDTDEGRKQHQGADAPAAQDNIQRRHADNKDHGDETGNTAFESEAVQLH
jgi:hypothetical protein